MNTNSQPKFTLALSSGFFGFYAHVGFLKALDELNIKPAAYTGTSAGAIVAAAAARGLTVKEIGTHFGDLKAPLRIPVFDLKSRSTKVFTSGNLPRIIRATCSVPLMFHPVRINRRLYFDGGIQDKMGIHGLDVNEKILSHYLLSSNKNPHSFYEMKRDTQTVKARAQNLIQIQLKGLPRAHPFAMYRGAEIIQAAYQKAMSELKPAAKNGLWSL